MRILAAAPAAIVVVAVARAWWFDPKTVKAQALSRRVLPP